MAKAGVDLKGITQAIDEVDRQVRALAKQRAPRAARSEMSAFRRALKGIRSKVTAECPPGMFRSFELGEAPAGTRAPTRRATRARKK